MAHFAKKIPKSQQPDKGLHTIYYPHTIPHTERKWDQGYYEILSIDPGKIKNFSFRIEKRYHNGKIIPLVFDKIDFESIIQEGTTTINNSYQVLTEFLNKYSKFYDDCHFFVIEKQLPVNYPAVRVSQHVISYFSIMMHNKPLLPAIVEIDSRLKGLYLGAPKGIGDKQLKTWSVEKGRYLLTLRNDTFSLQVLDFFKNKQDDLTDTVCQIEALMVYWGLPLTLGAIPPEQTDILSINGKIVNIRNINEFVIDGNIINITKVDKLNVVETPKKNKSLKLNIINTDISKNLETLNKPLESNIVNNCKGVENLNKNKPLKLNIINVDNSKNLEAPNNNKSRKLNIVDKNSSFIL